MRTLTSATRLLAVALIGLGLCTLAWAQKPPRASDPLPGAHAEPSPPGGPSPPSTRLEVPSGSDVKITIEILSKPSPPPAPAVAGQPPALPNRPHRRHHRQRLVLVSPSADHGEHQADTSPAHPRRSAAPRRGDDRVALHCRAARSDHGRSPRSLTGPADFRRATGPSRRYDLARLLW